MGPSNLEPGPLAVGGYIIGNYDEEYDGGVNLDGKDGPVGRPPELQSRTLTIDLGWARVAGVSVRVLGDPETRERRVVLDRTTG
jgi:hypothetical protein